MASLLIKTLGFLICFPLAVFGCTCSDELNLETSMNRVDMALRAVVIRKLKDANYESSYVVRIARVFKGCNVSSTERMIVTTGSSGSMCGVELSVNATYALTGFVTPMLSEVRSQLANRTSISSALWIGSCDYNERWSTARTEDIRMLRSYNNSKCVLKGKG